MLDLINRDRAAAGLAPVVLGDNVAAQAHAEEMLTKGYLSHWGLGGLKPYMRYTLAGGFNYEAENISASPTPIDESIRYAKRDIKIRLDEAEEGFINSPGHRANILNKWHKKVNIGIAHNSVTEAVVQQFEGDYVTFNNLPTVRGGILSMSGRTSEGFTVDSLQIWFDQTPHALTLGQVGATYAYDSGTPAAFLRPMAPPGSHYTETQAQYSWETEGPDPYSVSPDTPPPTPNPYSKRSVPLPAKKISTVKWVDSRLWAANAAGFAIEADLTAIMAKFGKGVYTVHIWGASGGDSEPLTNYSIFIK